MDTQNTNLIATASEFIPNRLYLVVFKNELIPLNTNTIHYFSIDDDLVYESFFNDFGPLNICMLYRYCQKLNRKLSTNLHVKKKIVHYTTIDSAKRLNAAFLIGAYAIINLNKTPQEAFEPLNYGSPYAQFCDASYGSSNYTISLMDCLQAVYKAQNAGFFDFTDFDAEEYEYYERVEYGDLNWIVPNKFVAFCGPHNRSKIDNGYPCHAPETYFNYFRQNNVSTIIRLNLKLYNSTRFSNAGFDHKELFFTDGSKPSDLILKKFLQICETSSGAIAVHCKAGLGRTGSLIGAYIMKHYRFSALEAIAWLRLCRPGSVIGHQQQWMEEKQNQLWMEGAEFYRGKINNKAERNNYGIYSIKKREVTKSLSTTTSKSAFTTGTNNLCGTSYGEILTNNSCGQTLKLKDRVRNISQKVDTMKLNDSTPTSSTNRDYVQRDENKNTTSGTLTVCSNRKLIDDNVSNSNDNTIHLCNNVEKTGQTQGDTLNQIKAMRRRHSRLATNETPATTLQNKIEPQPTKLHHHHVRARSQPFRTRSTAAASTVSTVASATNLKPVTFTMQNRRIGVVQLHKISKEEQQLKALQTHATSVTATTLKQHQSSAQINKLIGCQKNNNHNDNNNDNNINNNNNNNNSINNNNNTNNTNSDNCNTYLTGNSTNISYKDDMNRLRSISVQQRTPISTTKHLHCFDTQSHHNNNHLLNNQRNHIYLHNHHNGRSRSKTISVNSNCISNQNALVGTKQSNSTCESGSYNNNNNNNNNNNIKLNHHHNINAETNIGGDIITRKKLRNQTLTNADQLNSNVCINHEKTNETRRLTGRNRTRTVIINAIANNNASDIKLNIDNATLINNAVSSGKRGKRTLSSTQNEHDKSDEKNTKLLRKNAVLRSLSPLLVATTTSFVAPKTKLNCDDDSAINKRSKSICATLTTEPAIATVRQNKSNNKIDAQNNYVALRLRKRQLFTQ